MKRRQTLIVLMMAGAGLCAHAATGGNPYSPIVARNVFGLSAPPPPRDPAEEAAAANLPKITPNGIMTIFGKLQVLFKAASPGQPPHELSYVMGEGERQDDIEVQKIDEKAAMITFNNHGLIQTLELSSTSSGAGGAPGGMGGGGRSMPTMRGPAAQLPGNNKQAMGGGNRLSQNRNVPGAGNAPANANPGAVAPAANQGPGGKTYNPPKPDVTPEEQVILIEAQRMKAMQEGDDETSKLLPVTELTHEVTGEGNTNGGGQSPPAPPPGGH